MPNHKTITKLSKAPLVALQINDVRKSFGKVDAVNGINLKINQGEIVAILGPNGAGKTSTIDCILGLSKPDSGSVEVFERSPRSAIAAGLVSAVLQTGGLLKDFTVRETVELTASLFSTSRSIDEVLTRAGILELANRKVGVCSGGQQQRLRFAMALVSDPGLLILDEPTTGMDVEGRRAFWKSIRNDAEQGRTVVFATHYLDEADEYADRIVLMARGRVVADGTTAEIKNLVSGRIIKATLDIADHSMVQKLAGVESFTAQGKRVSIHTNESDSIVKFLLTKTTAHDIEVTSQNLETVFLQLTSNEAELGRN